MLAGGAVSRSEASGRRAQAGDPSSTATSFSGGCPATAATNGADFGESERGLVDQRSMVRAAGCDVNNPQIALIDERDLMTIRTPGNLVAEQGVNGLEALFILVREYHP